MKQLNSSQIGTMNRIQCLHSKNIYLIMKACF